MKNAKKDFSSNPPKKRGFKKEIPTKKSLKKRVQKRNPLKREFKNKGFKKIKPLQKKRKASKETP
ncbi:hypothetical protein CV730_07025 [Helicobacter pylori]|nr:hypothetical protein CV730_07025 [Helicobacter pylori]